MKKFQGNYIKRISFYAGLIAFFVALGFSIFTYFRDTLKEGESLIENAKSSLAPYIKWYQEDSSKELEKYRNLSKAEFEKLDVDLIIEKNLQDIKNIFEDVDILTRFVSSNGEYDEYGIEKVVTDSIRSAQKKFQITTIMLEKEINFDPQSTSYIINNSKRYQSILVFQDFLKTQIQKDILDTESLKRASFFRLRTYIVFISFYYSVYTPILLLDIQNNTCKIDKSIIQNTFQQYQLAQKLQKILLEAFDNKSADFFSKKERQQITAQYKLNLDEIFKPINKEQSTIQTIQSNLKKCK